jgi:predicted transcriptional regulator
MIQISVKDFLNIQADVNKVLGDYPNTKLSYAISKTWKKFQVEVFSKYQDELEDARIDLCSTDEKGNILKDEKGGYLFTKDSLKQLEKTNRELQNKKHDFEPYLATELPDGIDELLVESLKGIFIK